ncbi:MAG: amino acid ABC transporter ATP-binding protein [Mycoplasmatota bacterium]|nr:amino acid ABC transporter ATP-binding protein [Mycoplasmatota bacterium]
MLKIKNLKKSFNGVKVLKNINLEVEKGERIVIIGPSGSGKSTLLRCINRMTNPTSGFIYFNDILLTNENITEYRQKIGMVFQTFNLFNNLTVLNNIILAPVKLGLMTEQDAKKKACEYLKKINLIDKINVYPQSLSGGERQRVAIIRTLMTNPEIILFDEPTSALDPEMVKEVQELMLKLAADGMTMIIVTHEVSFVKKVATKIIFLDEGKIVCSGTYQDLINSDNETVKLFLSNIK